MTTNISKSVISKKVQIPQNSNTHSPRSKSDKVIELGPLESVFPCSASKILDFLLVFRNYDYSISDIARNSGVGFKTTLKVINNLAAENIIFKNRHIGKAILFKLNPESPKSKYLKKLASNIATEHAMKMAV